MVAQVLSNQPSGIVVDIAGGTARARSLFPSTWKYISVDSDERHLDGRADVEKRIGVASALPIESNSADLVTIIGSSHHSDYKTWPLVLAESHRILRPSGHLLFADGLYSKYDPLSRLFWTLDIGRHPRTYDQLIQDLESYSEVLQTWTMRLIHPTLLFLGRARTEVLVR